MANPNLMDSIPALQPPKGIKSNFRNPPRDNVGAFALLLVCLLLSTLAIIVRGASRAFVVRRIFLSDVLLFICYWLYLAMIGMSFEVGRHPGFFVHQWDVSVAQIIPYLHTTFAGAVTFYVFMGLIKTAILVEWLRVFVPEGKRTTLYYVLHATLWGNIIFNTTMVIIQNIACSPPHSVQSVGNRTLPSGRCSRINTGTTDIATAIINLTVDVCIIAIPQHVIWKLKLSRNKKVGLAGLFLIGVLGVLAAACGAAATVRVLHSPDFVYNFGWVVICGVAEGACAILIICGPTVPRVVEQLRIRFSTKKSSDGNSRNDTLKTWGTSATMIRGKECGTITVGRTLEPWERGPVSPAPARFELCPHAEEGEIKRKTEVIVSSKLCLEC